MTISMYKASAPIFVQFLTSLSAVLDKAAAHAEAKKINPAVLLEARLYPDMFPLVRQVREATSHAANACGRLAGADLLTFTNTEASIPDLKERIAKTIDFIKGLKPAQIDGTENKEITIKFTSGERKFTGQLLLLNFSLPNFYFHYTTAYDILRHCGVELANATLSAPRSPSHNGPRKKGRALLVAHHISSQTANRQMRDCSDSLPCPVQSTQLCWPALVALPLGPLRLSTRPSSTGSPPVVKTIGMVEVALIAATAEAFATAHSTSTRCAARSAANSGRRSIRLSAHLYLSVMGGQGASEYL
jgi:uncharacterized protein